LIFKNSLVGKTALVTGASQRIGAEIVRQLHAAGANVGIHYRNSAAEAQVFCDDLNGLRSDSAAIFDADLAQTSALSGLTESFVAWAGGLDVLVNNASTFYPTPMGTITELQWDELFASNLRAPLFLSQCAMPYLRESQGVIINLVDIHARRPLRDHAVYGSAKAGLEMLTRSLAKDLAPEIRVNGIAPGAILWPEHGMTESVKNTILQQIPLGRPGEPRDIAECVLYLVSGARYITGQVIAIDGGRSLGW
jgi:pteridine reductase